MREGCPLLSGEPQRREVAVLGVPYRTGAVAKVSNFHTG
ncbi:hypothetical protein GZL_00977 [Streptomyces sp. 769]|nr:hypothetical protein GZL_00977 [Streptomyces sp. 769]